MLNKKIQPGGRSRIRNLGLKATGLARRADSVEERRVIDGELDGFWGQAGAAIEAFFGCCNPAHLALLPDGRFVTSEKGIPRVKIYSDQGDLDCVVAGPQELGVAETALGDPRSGADERVFDIATDTQGRVVVLDSKTRRVRIFAPRPSGAGAGG